MVYFFVKIVKVLLKKTPIRGQTVRRLPFVVCRSSSVVRRSPSSGLTIQKNRKTLNNEYYST